MCSLYYSAVYDGQCVAVDGMVQPWDSWPQRAFRPGKPLLWVFPPRALLVESLLKIEREQARAVVVLPRTVSAEVSDVLRRLPVQREVLLNGPHRVMVQPTRRVPAQAAGGGWKMPLRALLVQQ